MHKQHGEITTI